VLPTFAAIDFETADSGRDSACSVGVVRVSGGRLTKVLSRLIRPPRRTFTFTHVHGLRWSDVAHAPCFEEVWAEVQPLLLGAAFIAAHNAAFDRSVLSSCIRGTTHRLPRIPVVCTVKLARRVWGIRPTKLPDVCGRLGIPLEHHDPVSDARACARIVLAAHRADPKEPFGFAG
jgi:DNA polymerase-3 subunit epsilon